MPVNVSPTTPKPTHHVAVVKEDGTKIGFILCDGQGNRLPTAIARANLQNIPLKTSSGESSYSDLELPFAVVAQDNWVGGAGQERFEDNRTKYLEGMRVQTAFAGQVIPGPIEHFTEKYRNASEHYPDRYGKADHRKFKRQGIFTGAGGIAHIAAPFTPTTSYTIKYVYVWAVPLVTDGSASAIVELAIYSDSAGSPGTQLGSTNLTVVTTSSQHGRWWDIVFSTGVAVTAATPYWLVIRKHSTSTATRHLQVGVAEAPAIAQSPKQSADGSAWSAYNAAIFFRVSGDELTGRHGGYYFEYKKGWYFLSEPDDGTAPKLYLNGWRGAADSNTGALTKLKDATQTGWAGETARGGVVIITDGPGVEEPQPWREVIASISGELTMDFAWTFTHTTATNYVVVAAREWTELAGHGIAFPPSDEPLEVNGILYVAQADKADIRRLRAYNNAGVWEELGTTAAARSDDTGNRAHYLITVDEKTSGTVVWRLRNISGGIPEASSAPPVAWGTNLTFAAAEAIGKNVLGRANNLIEFVDPSTDEPIPWVFLWDELWARREGKWRKLKSDELKAFASERTGKAALVHDTHLYFTLAAGLEQLTDFVIVDLGPNRTKILRNNREGDITALAGYPGRFFAALSSKGVSTIQMHTGIGTWEEHYRGIGTDRPIRALKVQPIPGSQPDRLWFLENKDLMWLCLPSVTTNPTDDLEYVHVPDCYITLSRMHANLYDRTKLWSSVKVVSEVSKGGGTPYIDVDWNVDTDSVDFPIANSLRITLSPSEEKFITNYTPDAVVAVRGKFIVLRLRISDDDLSVPVNVSAAILESLIGLPIKFSFSTSIVAEDQGLDLNNDPQDVPLALTYLDNLDDLADSVQVFTLQSIAPALHGKKVIIAAPEIRPIAITEGTAETSAKKAKERYVADLKIIQVVLT